MKNIYFFPALPDLQNTQLLTRAFLISVLLSLILKKFMDLFGLPCMQSVNKAVNFN